MGKGLLAHREDALIVSTCRTLGDLQVCQFPGQALVSAIDVEVYCHYLAITSPANACIRDILALFGDPLPRLEGEIPVIDVSLCDHIELSVELKQLAIATCYHEMLFVG